MLILHLLMVRWIMPTCIYSTLTTHSSASNLFYVQDIFQHNTLQLILIVNYDQNGYACDFILSLSKGIKLNFMSMPLQVDMVLVFQIYFYSILLYHHLYLQSCLYQTLYILICYFLNILLLRNYFQVMVFDTFLYLFIVLFQTYLAYHLTLGMFYHYH